ncbi:MAG TPA: HAD-IA family hydrolase [Castellaniella sp.]|uniref:HAD-IA family hydrolase n=1 Tax=Castellaniella sp. TaxID=1955812 RepID=UPI002F240F74
MNSPDSPMPDVSGLARAHLATPDPAGSKQYKAVIFDWDGTLMDSTHHITGSLIAACRDLGLHEPSPEEAGWVIGLSLQAALYRLVPELSADNADAFIACYKQHFQSLQHELHLFPGQEQLLQDLHTQGIILGVATGKSRRGLDAQIARLGLAPLFAATRCADEARGKPDPDMLEQLMRELNLEARDVLMVGDTAHDIQMAHAAGVDGLAVGYGAHAPEELKSALPTALTLTVPQMQAWVRAHV